MLLSSLLTVLGLIMLLDAFRHHIPEWVSPIATVVVVGYFFLKSRSYNYLASL